MGEILDIGGTERDFQWLGEPAGSNWGNRSEVAVATRVLRYCVKTLQVNLVRQLKHSVKAAPEVALEPLIETHWHQKSQGFQ